MNEQHLTEEQLQQYAAGTLSNEAMVTAHLSGCAACQQMAADYVLLFTALKEAPAPTLGFDVAALVMPQLPATIPAPTTTRYNNYLVPVIAVAAALTPAFIFRAYFINLVSSLPAVLLYPLLILPVGLIVLHCLRMYRTYQQKIKTLSVY